MLRAPTHHGFYDDSEVSNPVCQSDVTPSLNQMSYSLQVCPSGLCKLGGVSYVQEEDVYIQNMVQLPRKPTNDCFSDL